MTEHDLQKQICAHLNALPWCEAHIVSQMKRKQYHSGMRSQRHPVGASDIHCCVEHAGTGIGVYVCLEVKLPSDPMRNDKRLQGQQKFIADMESVGARGAFVTSAEAAEAIVEKVRNMETRGAKAG